MVKRSVLKWWSYIKAHIWTRSFPRSRGAPPPPCSPAVVRSVLDAFSLLTGGQSSSVPPEPRSFPTTPALHSHKASRSLQPLRPAMKQTLSELMRMSRICRMVFATCLGSFILVIFYFQSMFQPGRICLLSSRSDVCVYIDVWHLVWQPAGMLTHRFVQTVQ